MVPPTHNTPFVLLLFSQRFVDHRPAEDRNRQILRQSDNSRLIAWCGWFGRNSSWGQWFDTLGNPDLGAAVMSLIRNASSSFYGEIWPVITLFLSSLCTASFVVAANGTSAGD